MSDRVSKFAVTQRAGGDKIDDDASESKFSRGEAQNQSMLRPLTVLVASGLVTNASVIVRRVIL